MGEVIMMLKQPNTQWVLTGTALLGLASGVIGTFALLKKQSLIGDAMAHAALPGMCLAFILNGEKSIVLFMIGAAIFSLLATFCIEAIVKHSRIKQDSAISIVLSVFFGFGVVLLTKITQESYGNKSGLDAYLFGQAASLVKSDLIVISIVSAILLFFTLFLFKELKLFTFDEQFAIGLGINVSILNALLMVLIVGAIVIGLQTVGVVLMAAMLITPAIAARYWTDELHLMVIISGMIGAFSGMCGTVISTLTHGLSTGPVIVVSATLIFIVSFLFGTKKGIVSQWLNQCFARTKLEQNRLLITLYESLEKAHDDVIPIHSLTKLEKKLLKKLSKRHFVKPIDDNLIILTNKGLQKAYEITLNERLQEIFIIHENQFKQYDLFPEQKINLLKVPKPLRDELLELLKKNGKMPKIRPNYERGGRMHEL